MQAQIVIRQGWRARFRSQTLAVVVLAVATLMLIGVGLYALSTSSHLGASPAQVVSSSDQRTDGASQQPQHGNLSGDDGGAASGSGSQGSTHGQLP